MKTIVLRLGGAALLALALAVNMGAQAAGRGSLSGLVTDASGASIPGALVTITNVATGVTQQGRTSSSGLYSFVSLVPGAYQLKVSQNGFRTVVQSNITIGVEEAERVNVTMQVGAVSQTVTVSAAADIAAVTSSTVGQDISAPTISRIPLVNRDIFSLAQLSPGVIPQDGIVTSIDSGRDQVSIFTINGAQQGTMFYTLDGSPITIGENNQGVVIPALEPPLDSIQEVRTQINVTPASVESAGAGVISLVSKSGTNQFHGDVFGWVRPNGLDANDYFIKANGQSLPSFHRYQWGGSLGGPIKKNKMFFFGDYEGTSQASAASTSTTVPTSFEKQGDFSHDCATDSSGNTNCVTIYNPDPSTWASGPNPCIAPATVCPQPFAGDVIPTINPIAAKYLQYWPSPTGAGTGPYHTGNFFASGSHPENDERYDGRIDYTLSSSQHLFGRISVEREHDQSPNFFGNLFYTADHNVNNDGNIILGYDKTVSASSVLQLRASVVRHAEDDEPPGQENFDMTTLGFPTSLYNEATVKSIPQMSIGGLGGVQSLGLGGFSIFKFTVSNYDFNAVFNTVKGRYQLSFGVDYQKEFMDVGQTLAPAGSYRFNNDATNSCYACSDGDAFASFLLGVGDIGQGGAYANWTTDNFYANSNPYIGSFIQDDWHVTTNLTINAGLRWDIFPGWTERYNRMEGWDPNAKYVVNGVNLVGGEQFVTPKHRTPFQTNWRDFGPRFGLAYQFTKNAVLRGGFGITYGPSIHASQINQFSSDSFLAGTTWLASTFDSTGNYLVPVNTLTTNGVFSAFPNGILQPSRGSLGYATNLGNGLNTMLQSQPEMTTYNFNFGIQYEFPHQTILSAAWVGSRGLHLTFGNNVPDANQLPLQTIEQYQGNLMNMVPYPYAPAITDPTAPWYGQTEVPQYVMLEKYPQFAFNGCCSAGNGVLLWGVPFGDSIYHSLQVKLEKHLVQHFTTLASFTWSKLITNDDSGSLAFSGNNFAAPQDFQNLNLERGLSTQDIPYYFTWEMSYDLPIGNGRMLNLHGLANQVVGGWTVTSILSLASGQPIATPTGTGDTWFNQRPDIVGNCGTGAPKNVNVWFNYTCMVQPQSQYFPGKSGPVLPGIRTDGAQNVDLSLQKHFPIGEHKDISFRAAAYNLFNHPQFPYPNVFWNPSDPGTADQMAGQGFGQILGNSSSQANAPRQMSLEAQFTF